MEKKVKKEKPFLVGLKAFFSGSVWRNIKKHWILYLFLFPAVILIAVFSYGAMFGLISAFQDFNLQEGFFESEWIGFANFKRILFTPEFSYYNSFRNTLYISVIRILTNFPAILIFTLLLNEIKSKKAKGLVQTISYIPYFISWIAVGGMAYNLLSYDDGILNKVLVAIGGEAIAWYNEPDYWWTILAISSLWKGMGWSTLIYMSSLGSIDDELYDACTIDGGGKFRQAITVTLPGIMNVIMLQLILDVSKVMSDNYDQVMAMVNNSGMLRETTDVVGVLEYRYIAQGTGLGIGTAYGFIKGIIGLVLVLVSDKITKKTDNEGVL